MDKEISVLAAATVAISETYGTARNERGIAITEGVLYGIALGISLAQLHPLPAAVLQRTAVEVLTPDGAEVESTMAAIDTTAAIMVSTLNGA